LKNDHQPLAADAFSFSIGVPTGFFGHFFRNFEKTTAILAKINF